MQNHYGNYYDKYASSNIVTRWTVRAFLSRLRKALSACSPLRDILEVGCGDGTLSAKVHHITPAARIIGLEPGLELLRTARSRFPEIQFVCGTIYQLPFSDGQFDLVMAPEVLEHLDHPEKGLLEIARVSRSRLIISVPWEPVWRIGNMLCGRYLKDLGNTPGHVNHWSKYEFKRFVRSHLRIIKVFHPFPWTMILAEKK